MKKDIHPKTQEVVFKDASTGFQIITTSTVYTKDKIEVNGKTYPCVNFDVSSSSHPFYTGKQRLLDTEGRAERFMKKYKIFGAGKPSGASKPPEKSPKTEEKSKTPTKDDNSKK